MGMTAEAKKKYGDGPHNFGRPLGYAVIAPEGYLDGGTYTCRSDAERVIATISGREQPYKDHRIVELWGMPNARVTGSAALSPSPSGLPVTPEFSGGIKE